MGPIAPPRFVLTAPLAAAAWLIAGLPGAAQETLYVAEQLAGTVLRYSLPSTTGTTFGSGANPELFGLATGASGQLYTVNNTGDLIRRFDADGTLAVGFGSAGAVDIKTLTSNVAFGPTGVAFTAAAGGKVVVSAYNSGHLLRLDATTGVWDQSFGTGGLLTTTALPLSVAYAAAGDYIYYAQTDGKVYRVNAAGTENVAMDLGPTSPSSPWALSLLSDSELFLTEPSAGLVWKYDLSGTNATLDSSYDGNGYVGVPGAYGIVLSPTGTAYVTDFDSGTVRMISADGGTVQDFVTGLNGPTGITLYGTATIPEIDPTGLPAVAGIMTAVAGVLERRRSRRRARRGVAGDRWTTI